MAQRTTQKQVAVKTRMEQVTTCSRKRQWREAAQLVVEMECMGLQVDLLMRNAAGAVGSRRARAWVSSLAHLAELPKRSVQPDVFSSTASVSSCSTAREWKLAVQLLEAGQIQAVRQNVVAFGAALSGCSEWVRSTLILDGLQKRTLESNLVLLNSVASAADTGRAWVHVLASLGRTRAGGLDPDVISWNIALHSQSRGGVMAWLHAAECLSHMRSCRVPADGHSYSAVMQACETSAPGTGCWRNSFLLLDQLQNLRTMPDVVCCTAAIAACQEGQQWQAALALLALLLSTGGELDALVFNAAIAACGAAEHATRVPRLLQQMRLLGISPVIGTFNAAISASERCHRWEEAVVSFEAALQEPLLPDILTFSTTTTALEKGHRWLAALGLLHLTGRLKSKTDTTFCNAAISACEKGKRWVSALDLLAVMLQQQVTVDVITYSAVTSAFESAGLWKQAMQVLHVVSSSRTERNSVLCNAGISACQKSTLWSYCVALLANMDGYRIRSTVITFQAAILACASMRKWEAAVALQLAAQSQSIQPDVSIYNTLLMECEQLALPGHEARILRGLGGLASAPSLTLGVRGLDDRMMG